jgi:ABC-type transport system involved in multi-copper enzyme maturation permease subunit
VTIELRKAADTRAGLCLLAGSVLLAVAAVAVSLAFAHARDLTFGAFLRLTIATCGVLMPTLGILAVTSEWSQRTALTTFALVPRRERVIVAKLLAGLAFALASAALCFAISLVATALAPAFRHGEGTWDVAASGFGSAVLYAVLWMMAGAALGLLVMRSAPAIVLSFLIPLGTGGLANGIPGADSALRWVDLATASAQLNAGHPALTGAEWAHLATGTIVWVLLPLAIGFVRLHRREVTS